MPAIHQPETSPTVSVRARKRGFWGTPDQPGSARDAVWNELFDAGVDHINAHDLEALQQFLTSHTA